MADRLGLPVQRLQAETSSQDLALWKEYLELEPTLFSVERHYLAQIAREIRVSYSKKAKLTIEQFLLKFTFKKGIEKPKTETERDARIQQSKSGWFAMLGMATKVLKKE